MAMRALFSSALLLLAVNGCDPVRPPPLVPEPEAPPSPLVVEPAPSAEDDVPRSIRRLVAEQRADLQEMFDRADRLTDPHGRSRALGEIEELSRELSSIEADLGAVGGRSEELDEAVVRLQRLATRSALVRDALRTATS